jgi:hypothetical protein
MEFSIQKVDGIKMDEKKMEWIEFSIYWIENRIEYSEFVEMNSVIEERMNFLLF